MEDFDIPQDKLVEFELVVDRAFDKADRRNHALLTNEHVFLGFAQVEWDRFRGAREAVEEALRAGEPSVAKTAVVEGLTRRIEFEPERVPVRLGDCQIVNLQMNMMVAGTMPRGMFEDRSHNVILELVLAGGDVRIVGATTLSEYKEPIQEATALGWRFGLNVANADDAQSFLAGSRGASRSTGQSRIRRRWSCCPATCDTCSCRTKSSPGYRGRPPGNHTALLRGQPEPDFVGPTATGLKAKHARDSS